MVKFFKRLTTVVKEELEIASIMTNCFKSYLDLLGTIKKLEHIKKGVKPFLRIVKRERTSNDLIVLIHNETIIFVLRNINFNINYILVILYLYNNYYKEWNNYM